jgi:hypothetical protein
MTRRRALPGTKIRRRIEQRINDSGHWRPSLLLESEQGAQIRGQESARRVHPLTHDQEVVPTRPAADRHWLLV